jgi:hypothetical protein
MPGKKTVNPFTTEIKQGRRVTEIVRKLIKALAPDARIRERVYEFLINAQAVEKVNARYRRKDPEGDTWLSRYFESMGYEAMRGRKRKAKK